MSHVCFNTSENGDSGGQFALNGEDETIHVGKFGFDIREEPLFQLFFTL